MLTLFKISQTHFFLALIALCVVKGNEIRQRLVSPSLGTSFWLNPNFYGSLLKYVIATGSSVIVE